MSWVLAKRVMARWVPRLASTWMMALTDAEIRANVKAERSVVGTSSSWPLGGLLARGLFPDGVHQLGAGKAGQEADAGAEQLDEDVHSSVSLGRERGFP